MGGKADDPYKGLRRKIEGLSLPELEELNLKGYTSVGQETAEEIDPSAFQDITDDPRLVAAQMDALRSLQERGESGLTQEDKYMQEELIGNIAAQEKSQRAAIDQEMARRGMADSGQALMSKLQSTQGSANEARRQSRELGKQSVLQKMQAQQDAGRMAQGMQQGKFARDAQVAKAKDYAAQAAWRNRAGVAQRNLDRAQGISSGNVDLANKAQMYNVTLPQQQYDNQLAKFREQQQVPVAPQGPSTGQTLGGLVGGGLGAFYGGPQGAVAGYQAGSGMGAAFEDGGVAHQQAHDQVLGKAQVDSAKQHEAFKKKYMKRVQDEILGSEQKQAHKEVVRAEDGAMYASDGMGDVVDSGMESYAGDRVDAKINDGEMILNAPQQQRLMDMIRGEISPNELGEEDIVEGVPREYAEELHEEGEYEEESEEKVKLRGLEKLLEALGRS